MSDGVADVDAAVVTNGDLSCGCHLPARDGAGPGVPRRQPQAANPVDYGAVGYPCVRVEVCGQAVGRGWCAKGGPVACCNTCLLMLVYRDGKRGRGACELEDSDPSILDGLQE